jgi:hypothetical protein
MYIFRKAILFDNNKFKFASCFGHRISHTYLKSELISLANDPFWGNKLPLASSTKNFSKSMHITVTFLYFLCYFLSIRLLPPCPIAKVFTN